jgi:hypothetical protein
MKMTGLSVLMRAKLSFSWFVREMRTVDWKNYL